MRGATCRNPATGPACSRTAPACGPSRSRCSGTGSWPWRGRPRPAFAAKHRSWRRGSPKSARPAAAGTRWGRRTAGPAPSRCRPASISSGESRSWVKEQWLAQETAAPERRSRGLQGALREYGRDGPFLDPDLHLVGDFHGQEMLTDGFDAAEDAGGDHFVAPGQLGDHLLLFLGALLLRTDQQEIKDHEQQDDESERIDRIRFGRCSGRRGGGDKRGQHARILGWWGGRVAACLPKRRRIMPWVSGSRTRSRGRTSWSVTQVGHAAIIAVPPGQAPGVKRSSPGRRTAAPDTVPSIRAAGAAI